MTGPEGRRFLIVGYGNPGRQDDALGPAVAEFVEKLHRPLVTAVSAYQLNIEDAALLAGHDFVLFVDAATEGPEPFRVEPVMPVYETGFTTHAFSPQAVLAICQEVFGRVPVAWLMAIRGWSFELEESMTPRASANCDAAVAFVKQLINGWEERIMAKDEMLRRTVLIVDDDPDIRAAIRIVLESAGFSVGEAVDGETGMKVAERIHPDAILLDLMMETVDAGSRVSQLLKERGFNGPIYLLSSVGDAVRYNLDLKELGLAGIFQKPIDHDALINTLKTKLKIK